MVEREAEGWSECGCGGRKATRVESWSQRYKGQQKQFWELSGAATKVGGGGHSEFVDLSSFNQVDQLARSVTMLLEGWRVK